MMAIYASMYIYTHIAIYIQKIAMSRQFIATFPAGSSPEMVV